MALGKIEAGAWVDLQVSALAGCLLDETRMLVNSLLEAVLERRHARKQAESWLALEDDGPYSLARCAAALGVEVGELQEYVDARAKKLRGRQRGNN